MGQREEKDSTLFSEKGPCPSEKSGSILVTNDILFPIPTIKSERNLIYTDIYPGQNNMTKILRSWTITMLQQNKSYIVQLDKIYTLN